MLARDVASSTMIYLGGGYMSQYQTGELAKQKHVSVRTIQYYDKKGLLKTVKTGENGRRIFDEQSIQDLDIILVLKTFNFSLKDIKKIMNEKNKLQTVRTMLEQKETEIEKEMQNNKSMLTEVQLFKQYIGQHSEAPLEKLLATKAYVNQKSKMRQFKQSVLYRVVPIAIFQYTALAASILTRKWWPFLFTLPVLFTFAIYFTIYIYSALTYVCPNCQETFKPSLKQWLFTAHTPKTRKLQCPHCTQVSHCIAITQF